LTINQRLVIALAQYVDNGFLKPLRDKQEEIKNLQEWLKQAEFLNVDMQKSQQRLQEITQQGKEKKQEKITKKLLYLRAHLDSMIYHPYRMDLPLSFYQRK